MNQPAQVHNLTNAQRGDRVLQQGSPQRAAAFEIRAQAAEHDHSLQPGAVQSLSEARTQLTLARVQVFGRQVERHHQVGTPGSSESLCQLLCIVE